MKALTLHQPWASLVADGVKKIETRSWPPPESLIGERFAIHAGKHLGANDFDIFYRGSCGGRSRMRVLDEYNELPLGAVVCTAVLSSAHRVSSLKYSYGLKTIGSNEQPDLISYVMFGRAVPGWSLPATGIRIDPYGDFSPGRWVWLLRDIEKLDPPIPARGRQRLWNWEMTE